MNNIFKLMPKSELHLHIDGALSPDLALKIIKKENLYGEVINFLRGRKPSWLDRMRERGINSSLCGCSLCGCSISEAKDKTENFTKEEIQAEDFWASFPSTYEACSLKQKISFIEAISNELSLSHHYEKSQKELLKHFDLPCLLLQSSEALELITKNLIEEKARDKVLYFELRFAPSIHTARGLSVEEVIKIVATSAREAAAKFGVQISIIVCGLKGLSLASELKMLEAAQKHQELNIVGADYAGIEEDNPFDEKAYEFCQKAKELGFKLTFHGGEIWSSLDNLIEAMQKIKPLRIAHGSTLIKSDFAIDFLKKQNICLDLCPTSNIQAGLWPSYEAFPLADFIKKGVAVTLSTDDWIVSDISLSEEYIRLYNTGRYTFQELWDTNLRGLTYAFCDEKTKKLLADHFNKELDFLIEKAI